MGSHYLSNKKLRNKKSEKKLRQGKNQGNNRRTIFLAKTKQKVEITHKC